MLPDGRTIAAGGRPAALAGAPAQRPPRYGFLKGAALGFVLVIPSVALAVWVLARLGVGKPDLVMVEAIRMSGLFAGTAAVLTAGGVGRLAAHASTLPGGRRTATLRALRAQAVAGAGLTLIAAIPHGHLPTSVATWTWWLVGGAVVGAIDGALIGLVCGAPLEDRRGLPEMLRRVPMIAEWAKIVQRDPRLAAEAARVEAARREAATRPGAARGRAARADETTAGVGDAGGGEPEGRG